MTQMAIGSTDEARQFLADGVIDATSPALDRPIDSMTDREIAEETLRHQRYQRDVITDLIVKINDSPLGAMINGGSNPLMAMFGKR